MWREHRILYFPAGAHSRLIEWRVGRKGQMTSTRSTFLGPALQWGVSSPSVPCADLRPIPEHQRAGMPQQERDSNLSRSSWTGCVVGPALQREVSAPFVFSDSFRPIQEHKRAGVLQKERDNNLSRSSWTGCVGTGGSSASNISRGLAGCIFKV